MDPTEVFQGTKQYKLLRKERPKKGRLKNVYKINFILCRKLLE
jgi:hypothetical protein